MALVTWIALASFALVLTLLTAAFKLEWSLEGFLQQSLKVSALLGTAVHYSPLSLPGGTGHSSSQLAYLPDTPHLLLRFIICILRV